jgi:thiamine-monophosphate kinase
MFKQEEELVEWLGRQRAARGRGVTLGIGDDAALVRPALGRELILTSDWTIEDVHFRLALHPPASVGHRALARAISDVAAMGGRPRWALVSLAISRRVTEGWVKRFYSGMARLARRLGVAIVGGDTSVVSGAITVDIALVGDVLPGGALRRKGARPGDQIFVSGTLGLSALGLRLLETGSKSPSRQIRQAICAHLYPEPQCALGEWLARRRLATAMMDISDGLSLDLTRLCRRSGAGARIWETEIPMPAAGAISSPTLVSTGEPRRSETAGTAVLPMTALSPFALALHGGEDYQLLFTVPARIAGKIPAHFRGVALHRIGEIEKGRAVRIVRASGRTEPLRRGGFDHFRRHEL